MNFALLSSGGLGLRVLVELFHTGKVPCCVLTDKKSAGLIDFCAENDVPIYIGNPRGGGGCRFLREYDLQFLLSVNYLFLVEEDIIDLVRGDIFNIHGSLLPKYRGRTPHVWSIINGETETGATLHYVDQNCDTGDIVFQKSFAIGDRMTGNDILVQFDQVYIELINKLFYSIQSNKKIPRLKQSHEHATVFPKRTPDDGEIDWNWSAKRIFNWVRAQSDPYPGAFSWYKGEKVIIDWVEHSDVKSSCRAGEILDVTSKYIIVSNGQVEIHLTSVRHFSHFNFHCGDRLGDI